MTLTDYWIFSGLLSSCLSERNSDAYWFETSWHIRRIQLLPRYHKTSLSDFSSQARKIIIFTKVFSVLTIMKNAVAKTFSLIKLIPVVCWVNMYHDSKLNSRVLRSVCEFPCQWDAVPSDSCWSVLEQERNWIPFSCKAPAPRHASRQ